jgi:hypothetical protein
MSRFEGENGGGNLVTDAAEMTRDEIKFHNFTNRLRANFKELIVKPLRLQMLIEFPELKDDEFFVNGVDIKFYSNQVFEEWKKINNLEKKAGIVGTMLSVMNGEKPYFHIEWVMDNIFKLTPEEKIENQKYWDKDATDSAADASGEPGDDVGSEERGSNSDISQSGGSQSEPEESSPPEPESDSEFEF